MISIITPVYNSEKTLPAYFESLKHQTYQDYEVILVDDGSTDRSIKLCETFCKKDPRYHLFKRPHQGTTATANHGIKHAKGDYLSFIDSDDTVAPTFLETLIKNLRKHHADLSCCGYQEIQNDKITYAMKRTAPLQNPHLEILKNYQGFLANKLYRHDIITKNNLTLTKNLSMCADLLFNFQYLKHCQKVAYSNQNLYHYHINTDGLSRSLKKSWFDIITVYQTIMKELPDFPRSTQDYLQYNYLIAISEAKMRCYFMHLSFTNLQKKYHITPTDTIYGKLIKSPYLTHKEKLRLFLFVKHTNLARIIKFRRFK